MKDLFQQEMISETIAEYHQEILKKFAPEFEALHEAGFGVYIAPWGYVNAAVSKARQ